MTSKRIDFNGHDPSNFPHRRSPVEAVNDSPRSRRFRGHASFFSSLTFLDDDGSCDDLGQDRLGPALTILSVVVVVHHAALAANETHARATPGA